MRRKKIIEAPEKIWEENILKFEPGDKFDGKFEYGKYEVKINSRTHGGMYRGCHISFTAIIRPEHSEPYIIEKHAELWAKKTANQNEYRESFLVSPEISIDK
jgi:hypothetical protein